MAVPSWTAAKDGLEWDGALRDVYVLNTTRNDWVAFLAFVRNGPFSADMRRDDEQVPIELPRDFPNWEGRPSPQLKFTVSGILFVSHFFSDEVIELDIDPREVQTEERFSVLISFFEQVRDLLNKDVVLTHENAIDDVIIKIPAKELN